MRDRPNFTVTSLTFTKRTSLSGKKFQGQGQSRVVVYKLTWVREEQILPVRSFSHTLLSRNSFVFKIVSLFLVSSWISKPFLESQM